MPKCSYIKRKKRKLCIGDMDKIVTIQDRNIGEPFFSSVDFDEAFSNNGTVWASVKTVSGNTFFDGANTETNITHEFGIRYDSSVSSETWIEWDGRRFDILDAQDLEERKEWMILVCAERGTKKNESTKA